MFDSIWFILYDTSFYPVINGQGFAQLCDLYYDQKYWIKCINTKYIKKYTKLWTLSLLDYLGIQQFQALNTLIAFPDTT